MILHATHTHLFPGHRGTVTGLKALKDLQTNQHCLVEFADGAAATASISNPGNGWILRVSGYCTAAGTDISEKSWLVKIESGDGELRFLILGKIQTASHS